MSNKGQFCYRFRTCLLKEINSVPAGSPINNEASQWLARPGILRKKICTCQLSRIRGVMLCHPAT